MNPSQRFFLTRVAILGVGFAYAGVTTAANAALLAGWDFQGSTTPGGPFGTVISMPPTTPQVFISNAGVFQSTSRFYLDGTHGSSSFLVGTANGDTEIGALNGITANTAGTTLSTATTTGSLALFHRGGLNGKSAVFELSMDGYQDLVFSAAVQRPTDGSVGGVGGYGVNVFDFFYSTDGTNFLPWGTLTTGGANPVTNTAFTLGPVLQAVNDADSVFIKMTMSGATGFNSTRLDNIQFNATAVPEPAAFACIFAGAAILGARRRRASSQGSTPS